MCLGLTGRLWMVQDGASALFLAAQNGHAEVADRLIAAKCKLDLQAMVRGRWCCVGGARVVLAVCWRAADLCSGATPLVAGATAHGGVVCHGHVAAGLGNGGRGGRVGVEGT